MEKTDKNISVIILAGGRSNRYGTKNKLLELIDNNSVIEHAIAAFLAFDEIGEIIIPASASIKTELQKLITNPRIRVVDGGISRQESVANGLCVVQNDYVIIHDGARPLVKRKIIANIIACVKSKKAVSVAVPTVDTIKQVDDTGRVIKTLNRANLYNTQTPQAFETALIKEAHTKLHASNFPDDASMLEAIGIPVYVIMGDYANMKITTKSDLIVAKSLISAG